MFGFATIRLSFASMGLARASMAAFDLLRVDEYRQLAAANYDDTPWSREDLQEVAAACGRERNSIRLIEARSGHAHRPPLRGMI